MDMQNFEVQFDELKSQVEALNKKTAENKLSMIVFSGDLDKALAAFVIATGAVAMGMEVVMFFTFWGTTVLRDKKKNVGGKDMMGKMFGAMLPTGTGDVKLSNINMGGMGTAMMKSLMKKKNVASLEEMLALAEELGVVEFVDPELESLQRQIAEKLGYRLVDHRMELFGVRLDRDEKKS